MTELWLLLALVTGLIGFVVWLSLTSRKQGRVEREAENMQDTLDRIAEADEIRRTTPQSGAADRLRSTWSRD